MNKATKAWLIIAASLILIGGVLFTGVMSVLNWDFSKLSTSTYETNRHEINEAFEAISIHTDTADVVFVPSGSGDCSIVCHELKNAGHSVTVEDGTLIIKAMDTRKWYEHIGVNFGAPKITVYLPEAEYASLQINESTGDVEIPNNFQFESIDITVSTGDVKCATSATGAVRISASTGDIYAWYMSAGSLSLSTSTGDITVSSVICDNDLSVRVTTGNANLKDVSCKSLTSGGSTGDISLHNVTVAEKLSINRSTGDVKLDASDAAELFIETDTGDVEGSLLTDKIFITKTDTGRVSVPVSVEGGRCEITTNTGDIKITVK
ncbi:MAG: DUF4097 family beta strand repeat protein [Clostridia bacterium]|nr:DUF4097 family beta strand repeat protein [Clostridia bacterium]